ARRLPYYGGTASNEDQRRTPVRRYEFAATRCLLKSKTAMVKSRDRSARGGVFRELFHLLCIAFFWRKHVADGTLQCIGRNGGGDFQIVFEEVKKKTMFAELFPFRQAKLRNKLLVAFLMRHRPKS